MISKDEKQRILAVMNALGPSIVQAIQQGIDTSIIGKQAVSGVAVESIFPENVTVGDLSPKDVEAVLSGVSDYMSTELIKPDPEYVPGEEQVWAKAYAAALPGAGYPVSSPRAAGEAQMAAEEAVKRYRSFYRKRLGLE